MKRSVEKYINNRVISSPLHKEVQKHNEEERKQKEDMQIRFAKILMNRGLSNAEIAVVTGIDPELISCFSLKV